MGKKYVLAVFLFVLLSYYIKFKVLSQWPTYKIQPTIMMLNHSIRVMHYGTTNSRAIKRDFVVTSNRSVFVFGATGLFSSEDSIHVFNKFIVSGERYHSKSALQCCFKFADGVVLQHPIVRSYGFYISNAVPLPLFNVVCANPRSLHTDEQTALLTGMSIVYDGYKCNSSDVGFVEPFFPKRQPNNSFAITTKISHGHLSHDLLISWIEAYLWLGADKIVTYALSNLSADARRVLEYYAAKNVLDIYDYSIPELDAVPRDMDTQWQQTWTDASLTMFDAYARYSGYTYFSVIDWDEFILPSENRTLKQLLYKLYARHNNTAGVQFMTQFLLTSAPQKDSDVFMKKYTHTPNRGPRFDRQKIVYKPALARQWSSHAIAAIPGYKTLTCPTSEAFIRHYRKCRPNNSEASSCTGAADLDLVRDTSASQWADNIVNNVRKAREDIFASDRE